MKTLKASDVIGIKIREDENADEYHVYQGVVLDEKEKRKYTFLQFDSHEEFAAFKRQIEEYGRNIAEANHKRQ